MVDFLAATKKLTKHQAYQVVSLAGNVAVTQLVDKPNVGVHVQDAEEHLQIEGSVIAAARRDRLVSTS